VVNTIQLSYWKWIAEYYLCELGEVLLAAMPAPLRLSSETVLLVEDDLENREALSELGREEVQMFASIQESNGTKLNELSTDGRYPAALQKLLDLGLVFTSEQIEERYKPKSAWFIELHAKYQNIEALQSLMEELEAHPKQLEVLLALIDMSKWLSGNPVRIKQRSLLNRIKRGNAALTPLIRKRFYAKKRMW
jgi:primosomal protein N' (replication factor Y)